MGAPHYRRARLFSRPPADSAHPYRWHALRIYFRALSRKEWIMTRFGSSITGLIGAAALVIAGSTVDLHAQRGAGVGHGRPATAGTQAQGHGRPDTPGTQGQAHRPDTAGHTEHQPDTDK